MDDQLAHACDKGPLIDRLAGVIDNLKNKVDQFGIDQREVTLILKGNGVPGLTTEVEKMSSRLIALENERLTREAMEEANNRQFKKIAAYVGLLIGLFGLLVILAPLIQKALGMIAK